MRIESEHVVLHDTDDREPRTIGLGISELDRVTHGALTREHALCRFFVEDDRACATGVVALGEIAQPFIAGRYCDVTDILVGVAGLGIGWVVLRRAGFTVHGEMLPA